MEWADYLRAFAAFGFVLGLMGIMAWVLKRYNPASKFLVAEKEKRRIDIMEILPVDSRSRLILLRRDGTEHLVLAGADYATVIERDITSGKTNNSDEKKDATS